MNGSSSQNSETNLVQLDLDNTHAFVALERQGLRYIYISIDRYIHTHIYFFSIEH